MGAAPGWSASRGRLRLPSRPMAGGGGAARAGGAGGGGGGRGGGRPQPAVGGVGALRGLAAGVSAIVGGAIASEAGWEAALGTMALPPVAALALLLAGRRGRS